VLILLISLLILFSRKFASQFGRETTKVNKQKFGHCHLTVPLANQYGVQRKKARRRGGDEREVGGGQV